MTSAYALTTGKSAFERLKIVDKLYGEKSLNFLKQIGLKNCNKIVDVGCGTGQMVCRIARELGNGAQVVGIDQSEKQLAIAKKLAHESHLNNVEFICADIYECEQFNNKFDMIYCRSLLIHLPTPFKAINNMYQMLKQQGILACEEYNLNTCFSYPINSALQKTTDLFGQLAQKLNVDPEIGTKLFKIFKEIGLKSVDVNLLQITATKPEDKVLIEMGLSERAPKLLENSLVTSEELDKLYEKLKKLKNDEMSFIGYWRFCQTWGIK